MITIHPSPYGAHRVEIYEDGQRFVDCPSDQACAAIVRHLSSDARHFNEIAEQQRAGDQRLVVADGKAYSIGTASDYPRGFGGQPWLIHFFDGRIEKTVSLWFLGDIPTRWRRHIADNATLKAVQR